MYNLCLSFIQSDDNLNTAHGSDVYNPLWYVQTEAYDLKVTSDVVSVCVCVHCVLLLSSLGDTIIIIS